MSGDDDYVSIECEVIAFGREAVKIENAQGDQAWIPHSLLFGGDYSRLHTVDVGDHVTFKIRRWKLEKEGLI